MDEGDAGGDDGDGGYEMVVVMLGMGVMVMRWL